MNDNFGQERPRDDAAACAGVNRSTGSGIDMGSGIGAGADASGMFDARVYIDRREALRTSLLSRGVSDGLILFLGNRESPMNYADNAYPFRQDSSFLYFFGIAQPNLAATIDIATGQSTVFGDDVSVEDIVWTGQVPAIAELAARTGVRNVAPRAALDGAAARAGSGSDSRSGSGVGHGSGQRLGSGAAKLLFLPPYRADSRAELAELLGVPLREVDSRASLPLIASAIALREIKQAPEIVEIERAVAVSVEMHRSIIESAKPGLREAELAALASGIALGSGGRLAFPTIATTRGAVLHNHDYSRILHEGGLFLVDAGAETVSGYAGDLSSTFPISPRFSERQRAIYEIVLAAQEKAISLLKPGRPFIDAHFAAARVIVEGLSGLGLMRGDPDEAVRQGAHAMFFPCGVGHQMGLDVHDMENYGEVWVGYDGAPKSRQFGLASLRLAKPLRAGMVHTVEPGIYFIPELIARWKAERKLEQFIAYDRLDEWLDFGGMRNEEDWLITETAARRLGPEFDKSAEGIESSRD
ncbi:MAG TPA: aminopeptidase P family protein [Rectinemataceae bacterium]|nr:aminopeptidase P family protein [Rectinemataceae bacterium]